MKGCGTGAGFVDVDARALKKTKGNAGCADRQQGRRVEAARCVFSLKIPLC